MSIDCMTFIDFCSGIGAGRLGLEKLGLRCLAHSEINAEVDSTYKIFFNDKNNLGDLTAIPYEKVPIADILIAGFPCQTFSIVGKRAGFAAGVAAGTSGICRGHSESRSYDGRR